MIASNSAAFAYASVRDASSSDRWCLSRRSVATPFQTGPANGAHFRAISNCSAGSTIGERAYLGESGQKSGRPECRWRRKTQLALRREEERSRTESATNDRRTAAHPKARTDERSPRRRLSKIVGRGPREHRRRNLASNSLTRREVRVDLAR
jgi:hypothetical protein